MPYIDPMGYGRLQPAMWPQADRVVCEHLAQHRNRFSNHFQPRNGCVFRWGCYIFQLRKKNGTNHQVSSGPNEYYPKEKHEDTVKAAMAPPSAHKKQRNKLKIWTGCCFLEENKPPKTGVSMFLAVFRNPPILTKTLTAPRPPASRIMVNVPAASGASRRWI